MPPRGALSEGIFWPLRALRFRAKCPNHAGRRRRRSPALDAASPAAPAHAPGAHTQPRDAALGRARRPPVHRSVCASPPAAGLSEEAIAASIAASLTTSNAASFATTLAIAIASSLAALITTALAATPSPPPSPAPSPPASPPSLHILERLCWRAGARAAPAAAAACGLRRRRLLASAPPRLLLRRLRRLRRPALLCVSV